MFRNQAAGFDKVPDPRSDRKRRATPQQHRPKMSGGYEIASRSATYRRTRSTLTRGCRCSLGGNVGSLERRARGDLGWKLLCADSP